MNDNKILQKLECKNWIYSLAMLRLQGENPMSMSIIEKIKTCPTNTMKSYGFYLAAGSEDSILIWDTNF